MNITRRSLILGGMSAFASSKIADAYPVKSLFGAEGSGLYDPSQSSNNPYITNGLIGMWDGEWNVGFGENDVTSDVWKDLSGNSYDFTLTSLGGWGEKCFINASGGVGANMDFISNIGTSHQFEIIFSQSSYNHYENTFFVYLSPGDTQSQLPPC